MFSFNVQGRIGAIQTLPKSGLRISVAAERITEGAEGKYTRTEWLSCISFDETLNGQMRDALEVGQTVQLQGRIEPRKRTVEGKTVYDTSLFIAEFKPLSKAKPKTQAPPTPAAS